MTASSRTTGVLASLGAYLMWGVLPLYFVLLAPMSAWEVVPWRVVFSLVFCVLLVLIARSAKALWAIVRRPKLVGLIALGAVLVYVNWQTFVIGTQTGHVVETSLGYFINPIVTVLLGVLVLHERLRALQWIAVALAVVAVAVTVIAYGRFPWIAIILALSFGFYGLVKNVVGPSVDAVSGLTLETALLVPIALGQLVIVASTTGLVFATAGTGHTLLVIGLGVTTAVPLLLFAVGARRIPLSLVGILQFTAPILQFVMGVFVLGEPMPAERWIGFAVVWAAVVVFVADSLITHRKSTRDVIAGDR